MTDSNFSKTKIIHQLNRFVANELSAADVYTCAIDNIFHADVREKLEMVHDQHLERAKLLQMRILDLGGMPRSKGDYALPNYQLYQLLEASNCAPGEKVVVMALEDEEAKSLEDYRHISCILDEASANLILTDLLPGQTKITKSMKTLRQSLDAL